MAKKPAKKVRIDFRKNRQNAKRENDFTRRVNSNESEIDQIDRQQRMSGKGELSRKRTILGEQGKDDSIVLTVDENACLRGRVLSAIGSTQCTVRADDDQPHAAGVAVFRDHARTQRRADRWPRAEHR